MELPKLTTKTFSCFSICLVAVLSLLFSCARQSSPDGGAKDEVPPKVMGAEPGQEAVNFNARKIFLEFSEYVRLNNLEQELIVSPYMKKRPEVYLKGKKVVIKMPDSLMANTTYSLNFGDAIVDITEGNKAENLTYIFSTGAFIDSLSVKGKLTNAADGKAVKDGQVFLYTDMADSLIFKQKPDYVAKTNEGGFFQFNNLPSSGYQLAALVDGNNNLIYDSPKEQLAFYDELVVGEDSVQQTHQLLLYHPKILTDWTYEASKDSGVFKISTSNIDSLIVKVVSDSTTLYHYSYNYNEDTLLAFYNSFKKNTQFALLDKDSILDTISIEPKALNPWSATFKLQPFGPKDQKRFQILPGKPLQWASKYPVQSIESKRITVVKDSLTLDSVQFSINKTHQFIVDVAANWRPESVYKFIIEDSAVTDVFGRVNVTDTLLLRPFSEDDFTAIELSLSGGDSLNNYLAELYAGTTKLLHTQTLDSLKTTFKNIIPGKYSLKIIEDLNFNGQWDNGIYGYVQPEKILNSGEKPFEVKKGVVHSITLKL